MSNNFGFIDIILLAMIAGFILSNLAGCAVTSETTIKDHNSRLTIGTGVGVGGEVTYESN